LVGLAKQEVDFIEIKGFGQIDVHLDRRANLTCESLIGEVIMVLMT
jgi:hypothetical protein